MHIDPWRRTWRGLVSGAIAASVALGVFVYRQPALDGAAALSSSVDSLRQLAQSTGLWQSEQAKAGPSNLQFRIAPAPLPFGVPAAAPAHGLSGPAATQESA